MSEIPCPCCGFLTLEEEYGSYVICSVCGWEDDGVQLANPTSAGGANSESLAEAQARAMEQFPSHVEIAKGYRRSERWRALNPSEMEAANLRKEVKHWHSMAVLNETEAYWFAR